MFHYINGRITYKGENFAVIDAGGVGYRLYTTQNSLSRLNLEEYGTLYTYLRVGEDVFDLYGFISYEELSLFQMLLGVNGIGAKAAISILSALTPAKFAMAVVTNDVNAIRSANGIGMKLAQRLILELKDKFKNDMQDYEDQGGKLVGGNMAGDAVSEAINALIVLGYTSAEAKKAVSGVDSSVSELEDIVKQALRNAM